MNCRTHSKKRLTPRQRLWMRQKKSKDLKPSTPSCSKACRKTCRTTPPSQRISPVVHRLKGKRNSSTLKAGGKLRQGQPRSQTSAEHSSTSKASHFQLAR